MPGADKFLGVSLYAAKQLKKEKPIGKTIAIFKKGDFVGIIDSWVVNNGKIYWLFYEGNKYDPAKSYYVEHQDNNFIITPEIKRIKDLEAKKQKLKDTAELKQYQEQISANQSWYDKFSEQAKKYIPWIIGGILAAGIIKEVIRKKL